MRLRLLLALAAAYMVAAAAPASAGPTLAAVQERGFLKCGVNTGLLGFSAIDQQGEWSGLDVDFCRAFAAAVLGDGNAVELIPLGTEARFAALQQNEIDILSRNTTWTFKRETSLGLDFTEVTYYDGQGFLGRKSLGAKRLRDLKSRVSICVASFTTTENNLASYAEANNLDFKPVRFGSMQEAKAALFLGRCDLLTTDRGGLASIRATEAPNPDDFVILDDIISKEPLGPFVRDNDPQWRNIVRWVVLATIEAEEAGISSANVVAARTGSDPVLKVMLGAEPGVGEGLGLKDDWVYQVIRQVGNYAEIFARNLGPGTPVSLERGLNALWSAGGLMYAPPLR
jgi:general L-amino acid transport system substrate-binding protein